MDEKSGWKRVSKADSDPARGVSGLMNQINIQIEDK